jgi:UTP--glucose-1-phosphate uridylyltransferase
MICSYVRQPRALGLGHAVLCAKELIGQEAFAVLLADDLMVGRPSITTQMVEQFANWQASILAVQDVPREHTKRYGIVSGQNISSELVDVSGIVEKPAPEIAPTTLAVAGRYILTPGIFKELEKLPRGVGGEIQLTDGIAQLLRREKVFAFRYKGKRYDCGSKLGFLQATVDLAVHHDEIGEEFSEWFDDGCKWDKWIHYEIDGVIYKQDLKFNSEQNAYYIYGTYSSWNRTYNHTIVGNLKDVFEKYKPTYRLQYLQNGKFYRRLN